MRKILKRTGVLTLCLGLFLTSPLSTRMNMLSVVRAENRSAVIRGSSVNVRAEATTDSARVTTLSSNTSITVTGEKTGSDGNVWYAISYSGGSGYVRSDFVKFPVAYTTDQDFEAYLSQQGFPESYKPALRQLHAEFPAWVFTARQTGLDWDTALSAEMEGARSLVGTDSISSYKSTEDGKFDWSTSTWPGFDGASWVAASREITAYYMDPRNFLDESYVFQFLKHEYNSSTQTLEGVQSMVTGTFLAGNVSGGSSSSASGSGSSTSVSSGGPGSSTSGSTGTTVVSSSGSTSSGSSGTSASSSSGTSASGSSGSIQTGSGSEYFINFSGPGEVSDSSSSGSTTDSSTTDSSSSGSSASVSTSDSKNGTTVISAEGSTETPGSSSSSDSTSAPGSTESGSSSNSVTVSYSDVIMKAAAHSGVNPYVLTSMILQEQGTKGTSGSISGSSGYYNFFNVGAYASDGMGAVERGIWYASQSGSYGRPWNSIESSIVGGADFYAANYVDAGQNTLYLKKWNVQGSNLYKHQYMTNVEGAAEEGAKLSTAYKDMKSGVLEFSIPVYENMPETAAAKPVGDGNPNNKLSGLGANGFTLSPSFSRDTYEYTLTVDPSVTEVTIGATAIESHASVQGTGSYPVNGSTTASIVVTAQNGSTRTYTILIQQQAGGQTSDGSVYTSPGSSSGSSSVSSSGSSTGPGGSSASSQTSSTDSGSTSAASNVSIVEVGAGPV